MDPRSNPGRGFWIGRLGRFGAWGRRRVTAGDPARGGGALGSPDLAKPGRPGSNRPVFGSAAIYGAWVVYLGSKRSSGRLG